MRDLGQPKSRFAESIKKIGNSLLNLFRGDFLVFLLFLVITTFFWWSQTMSQEYQTMMKVPVQISGIPDEVRLTESSNGYLSVLLSGKGTALRKSTRRSAHNTLVLDYNAFATSQGHASLPTLRLRDSIMAMLPASVSIKTVEPDSLTFQYSLQHVIMLPVEFNGSVESQDQFFLERIEFLPESVNAKVLLADTILHHAMVDIDNVVISSDSTSMTLALKPVPGVLFDTEKVEATFIAQQYTEKSFEVPVTGVNFPRHLTLKSFPSKVVVSAWVKMSEYDKVGPNDFQVVVDYNEIAGREGSKAVLRIFSQPANVRNVKLQARTVDYLIETRFF